MKRFLLATCKLVLRTFFLLAVALLLFQCKMIYHPRGYDAAMVSKTLAEPLGYATPQGRQVAWVLPTTGQRPASGSEPVWLVFYGNGGVALDFTSYFAPVQLKGERVVLFDYPGYGQSEGRPSPQTIRESIRALMPALAAKLGTTPEALRPRLRVWGQSLGCAAALIAMEELGIDRGVLIAPFTTMMTMARRTVGWPLCELLHHRFDNVAELEKLRARGGVRLKVFHGTDDEVIPFAIGQDLARQFPDLITFEALPQGHHNDIVMTERVRLFEAMASMNTLK